MNLTSAGLSAFDAVGIRRVVRSLVTDADNGAQSLTWYTRGETVYNPGAGTSTTAETATSVTAFVGPVSAKEVETIEGAKVGDVQVLTDIATLATVNVGDRFTDSSDAKWAVYLTTSSPLSSHHLCYARKVI